MLAELAAANAAFAIIKSAIANGKELHDTGVAVTNYFDNKSKIQKNFTKKGRKSDLEEFFALEKIKEQEAHLRELMIYAGRAGLWDDWLRFQSDAKRQREREEALRKKASIQRIEQLQQLAMIFTIGIFAFAAVISGLFLVLL